MRARITRTVPTSHPRFALAPGNAAQREPFDQIAMTELLRNELESFGLEDFLFETSRRHRADGDAKHYQFDISIPCDVEHFNSVTGNDGLFDAAFNTMYEAVENGETFEGEDEVPHSAIAAVGNIVS